MIKNLSQLKMEENSLNQIQGIHGKCTAETYAER